MNLPEQTGFLGHPRGLRTLFFAEFWERFSYYGMRALLILFMTTAITSGGMGMTAAEAGPIYGMYTALVYLMSLPGGWIADRITGQRKAVFWGGVVIMFGHIALAIPSDNTFFIGLGLIILGTGLLKPNISAMVGQLYAPGDERRDAGFSLFYMGINLGAMIAPIVTSGLAQGPGFAARLSGWGIPAEYSWHFGFGAAAVGMFLGLVWYVIDGKALGDAGKHAAVTPAESADARGKLTRVVIGIVALVAAMVVANSMGIISLTAAGIRESFNYILPGVVLVFFGWLFLGNTWTTDERKRLMVIVVLFFAAAVFWSVFEQAGSTLTLFADRSTRNEIFGKAFTSGSWQSVNSAWVVILAPIFAWIWVKLGAANPSSLAKFALGLFFASLSFVIMVPAATMAASGDRVGWWWLMGSYFLASVGEMCLSPVGLSAMTKLAPARVSSLMMGVWFLATSVGSFIAGKTAGLYETLEPAQLFGFGASYAMVFAVVLALMVKPIKRMLARAD